MCMQKDMDVARRKERDELYDELHELHDKVKVLKARMKSLQPEDACLHTLQVCHLECSG